MEHDEIYDTRPSVASSASSARTGYLILPEPPKLQPPKELTPEEAEEILNRQKRETEIRRAQYRERNRKWWQK